MNNWLLRLMFGFIATVLFSVSAHAEVVTVEGTLKSVDTENRSVSVEIDGKSRDFDVTRKIKVKIDGKERALEDLEEGTKVKVSYHDDLDIAISIQGVSAKEPVPSHSGNPTTPQKESDPEKVKAVLEWVFSKGGDVSYIDSDGKEVEGIQDLDDLPEGANVMAVRLEECEKLGNHQLERLVSLPHLKSLSLSKVKDLSDDDLKDVALIQDLEFLYLTETSLNGSGFRHLKNCKKLRVMYCGGGTPIKDNSLTHLTKIPTLRVLGLGNTKVTDTGMNSLAALELEDLLLMGCRITDRGLQALQACKSLKKISIKRTGVSKKGVASFRAALPNCEVFSDF